MKFTVIRKYGKRHREVEIEAESFKEALAQTRKMTGVQKVEPIYPAGEIFGDHEDEPV